MTEKPVRAADYAAFNVVWATLVGGLCAATDAQAPPAREIPLLGVASFTLTKALAREKVGTWVRGPLVDDPQGERRPKGTGVRYVAGELITCTRCLGTWSALGLVGLRMTRPREGRVVMTLLAASAVNDFLQAAFAWTTDRANAAHLQASG